ncbi:MAG: MBL fold metallo-hydrolase [Clostridiales bacterium]|nr:MBL fold metallo-hydrolase [Clostridiales bacterium]
MNLVNNITFLSKLTYNNVIEYFKDRLDTCTDTLTTNSIYWYGHATTLININNTVIITDPVLSNSLGYFKRIVKKPLDISSQKIDYILLSHGHMDHLHFPSLRKLKKLNPNITVIVPKGYKKLMKLLGFKNIVLIRQGQTYKDNTITVKAIKANHDGRRFYVGIDNESNSYLINISDKTIFYAGDTAYTEDFNGIKCDAAIMPVGCYMPERFSYMHCTPKESYNMFQKMNCDVMIPVHYKTFKISLEDFDETERTLKSFKDSKIKILNIGNSYKL